MYLNIALHPSFNATIAWFTVHDMKPQIYFMSFSRGSAKAIAVQPSDGFVSILLTIRMLHTLSAREFRFQYLGERLFSAI